MSENTAVQSTKLNWRWRPYPEYKESGIEWLGQVPEHWQVRRLKYAICRNDGGVWGDDFDPDGVVVLRSTDMTLDGEWRLENPARRKLSVSEGESARLLAGDLVLTKSSGSALHLGKTALVTAEIQALDCCFSNFMQRLRVRRGFQPEFLYYLLNCPVGREQLIYLGSTTTGLANLNAGVIGSLFVPVPTLSEQHAITDFLDRETAKIDALVSSKGGLIELLQEKRLAIISHAVTKGLDPGAPMKESGVEWLGQIPTDWNAIRLKFAATQKPDAIKTGPFGSQLLVSEMMGGEVKVYNQRNVIDRDLTEGDSYISRMKHDELRAFTVYPGDILLTTRGTIGRCMVVPEDAELGILHPCLMRIQPNPKKLLPEFLTLLVQDSSLLQTELLLMSNATTIEVIYSDTMRQVTVPMPPLEAQRKIVAYLQPETSKIDTLIAKVRKAMDKLKEYRTALISAAVTGKIDVRGEVTL